MGLRTVDGSFNNLVPIPDQHLFGAADLAFPRLTTPVFRAAEPLPFDPDGAGRTGSGAADVIQAEGRIRLRLAAAPYQQPDRRSDREQPGGRRRGSKPVRLGRLRLLWHRPRPIRITGSLFIPNITPDFGLSAPFNLMFTFFGQFFDHGLDLVTKGGGTVIMPLQPDDPLFVPGSQTNFMVMTRGQNQPGPDGILGNGR